MFSKRGFMKALFAGAAATAINLRVAYAVPTLEEKALTFHEIVAEAIKRNRHLIADQIIASNYFLKRLEHHRSIASQ